MTRRRGLLSMLAALALSTTARAQIAEPPPQSLTLPQALQYALDHYPAVQSALEQVIASTAGVDVARAAYLPRVDSFWQTNRATANNVFGQLLPQPALSAISGPVLPSATAHSLWGTAVGALFSWEPLDLGLRSALVREAEAGVGRARADEGLARLTVQHAVGSAFLGLVSAQQAVAAADADVQRRDVLARTAHALADNQLRPGADASRADAERAATRTRAIQARQAMAVAEATLAQVLGTSGPVSVDAARLLDTVAPNPPSRAAAPQHPLLQSGQAALDVARAQETVLAKTDRPRLYVQSSVFARGSGANPDGLLEGGPDGLWLERANWAAGLQVILPNLFDFASLRARRTAAGAVTHAEAARYHEAVLAVTSQQRAADAVLDAVRAIAENTPIQLAAAQQSEAQARARYQAGLAGMVEVAEAQNLLAAAEYQDAAARLDVWRALLAQAAARGSLASFIELLHAAGVQ